MFVCIECGYVFQDAECWKERHGFDYGPYENFSGCPECGGSYVEAHKCDCCDKWITGSYIKTEDGKRYCENCYVVMDLEDEE